MRVAVFDTRSYDRQAFEAANLAFGHELSYFEPRLTSQTAALAVFDAVQVGDSARAGWLTALVAGVSIIALMVAGRAAPRRGGRA